MCQTLHVDERLEEQERARLGNVIYGWIRKVIPLISGPPRGWRSLDTQLRQRPRFPAEAWSGYGPQEEVIAILNIVREELAWPNHHFIPDDPLMLIVRASLDEYGGIYLRDEVEERYAVKYTDEELDRMRKEQWTLGRFVKDVLERPREDRPVQYSGRALWGFFIPLVALVVLCVRAIAMPRQYVDYVYGAVVGLCFLLVLAKGWLLSYQGMREIGRSAGKLKGRGFAIAGQVIAPAIVILLAWWFRYL